MSLLKYKKGGESLKKWFSRNKGKGWIDCSKKNEDGSYATCGRKSATDSDRKYPQCRPTPSDCNDKGKGTKWGKKRGEKNKKEMGGKFYFQNGGTRSPFSTYTSQENSKGGPRNTNYNILESYENKPLHLQSIDEELYNNSPNYKATTKDAYNVQKGIKDGLIQVIPNQDSTFRYVNTGEIVPDDTHEMLFSAGKGAIKAGIKGANLLKGAGDGLSEYYLPRDFLQATGFTVQAIDKALEGENPMKDGLMAALRFAQSNTPGLGGKYNPIIAGLMKLPAKALAQFPNLNRLLRGSGLYYSMDKESPGSGGKRLDRPAYSKLSNRVKENITEENISNNDNKSFEKLNEEYRNNELKNKGKFFSYKQGSLLKYKKGGMTKSYCLSTPKSKMGFSQRASCKSQGYIKSAKKEEGGFLIFKEGGSIKDKTPCNKPRRIRKGESGYGTKEMVVKGCENGKEKLIRYGDANMTIKKDNPERRKSFRARHKCDEKKSKLTAGYWSCKRW